MESAFSFNLAPWVVFFPLIGLMINLLVGRKFGELFAGITASAAADWLCGIRLAGCGAGQTS